ncbi:DUF4221 family protein [Algoriphagus sp.]|uniref:DUF4221 family protein n=1 Tax=Algoriphagus sp. TaxID=1872435 RepID=UPI00271A682E|nr:DUF4221 family protein [Algoriphagus sp.]MDO8966148.1 DUF4221 family protein [Algoriphagus sp.]
MKTFLVLIIFASFFSCSEKKPSSSNPLDYITDTTAISIDRKTETYTRSIQYLDGDLYWWNPNRETISVFDLSSKRLKNIIKMETDGPNGIGRSLGFYIVNPDSIYVPNTGYKLNLINAQGNKLEDYDYGSYPKLGGVISSMTRYSTTFQTNNLGVIYLGLEDLRNIESSDLDKQTLKNYPPILSFNKLRGTFEYLNFRIPESILKFKDAIEFSFTSASSSLFLLHNRSNTLYGVHFSGDNFKEYQLQSDLLKNFSNEYYNSPRMSNSIEENMNVAFKSAENLGLVFDHHKKLLYRFGWPGEEISNDKDAMKFGYTPRYFTISIYDGSDFSLIKEFTLPRNTYLAHHYFVDEKGLNLFPMHPDNPEFNEDEMVIHTFDFSELK